jgi:hypothetical protein
MMRVILFRELYMRLRLSSRLSLLACLAAFALAACGPERIAQFWRPISEPNIEMPLDKVQRKLEFDLSQCHCGIYPTNTSHSESIEFQPDKQQMVATGSTVAPNDSGQCISQPSLIVSECMRQRGWEPTSCSGRMPLPGGGALCTSYELP